MQKYAKEHPNEKMLYLAPQDEILHQIKKYIIEHLHGKQGTIGKTEDEIIKEVDFIKKSTLIFYSISKSEIL